MVFRYASPFFISPVVTFNTALPLPTLGTLYLLLPYIYFRYIVSLTPKHRHTDTHTHTHTHTHTQNQTHYISHFCKFNLYVPITPVHVFLLKLLIYIYNTLLYLLISFIAYPVSTTIANDLIFFLLQSDFTVSLLA